MVSARSIGTINHKSHGVLKKFFLNHRGSALAAKGITHHGIKARRAFADGVTLLGIVNAAAGFLFEWGTVDGISIKGVTLVTALFTHGPDGVFFGAKEPGDGILFVLLPLAVTLPAMIFMAARLKSAGRVTPAIYLLSGAWGTIYLFYSALLSRALMGFHGPGFGVTLLGFTLVFVGGSLRWRDSSREADQILRAALLKGRAAENRELPRPARSVRQILAELLLPPPVIVFPLPRRRKLGMLPPATLILIVLNVLCFALCNFRDDFESSLMPALCFCAKDFHFSALLTSQFVHFGVIHLLANMFVLFLIGNEIERVLGWPLYLAFYLVGGALANLVLGMAFSETAVISAGASGSIATLLGLMLVLMPGRPIQIWFFQIISHRVIEFRAGWILSVYLVFQTVMAVLQTADYIQSSTGFWNHLGGMFYGLAAALLINERVRPRLEQGDLDSRGLAVPFTAAALAVATSVVALFCLAAG